MSNNLKSGFNEFIEKLPPSLIKSSKVSIFPEGAIGYLIGPTLAMLANSILSSYFNKYMSDILGVSTWAKGFFTWLPVISVIFVVAGNIIVGRLMDSSTSRVAKARPLLLFSVPISLIALLFLFIFAPFDVNSTGWHIGSLICIAIGYNIWFGIAYPMYFTPHSALVGLSTRDSKDRSLLATISNATHLAAMGLTSMILPFFLGMLFKYDLSGTGAAQMKIQGQEGLVAFSAGAQNVEYYVNAAGNPIYDTQASYNAWKIFVIALIIITLVGALVEYFFTRERVTEEGGEQKEVKKALPLGQQAKICFSDKFWIIMILFFVFYQLSGMMKNVSQLYYCTALFQDAAGKYTTVWGGNRSGLIAIIGAVPTAIGMVVAVPLANKFGKAKAIMIGAAISALGGLLGLIFPDNFIVAVIAFVIKALGSTPAMYLSLALLADIMDHQEALHGGRTDGLSMTIYGAIMAGMTGIATGILNVVISSTGYDAANGILSNDALRATLPWIFFGGEMIGYGLIALTFFLFMKVEKFSDLDHKAIIQDQRALAAQEGREYVLPEGLDDSKEIVVDGETLNEFNKLRVANGRSEVKL
ncbi:MAG: MFS transporter [Lachnospiraceae bacterium]|nr:MFS transporter [Lachnospiraceae bacterium]